MLQRVLAIVLSFTIVLGAAPIVSAAATAGQISGVASGEQVAGQVARLRNLDLGQVAAVTTTSASGAFAFSGISEGNYIVELVSNGSVVGTTVPVTLTSKNMTVQNLMLSASAAPAAFLGPVGSGSFWTSTFGMITVAAIGAGLTTAIVVTKNDASSSK